MPHVGDFGTFTTIPSHHAFREEICANLKGWEEPRMASPKKKNRWEIAYGPGRTFTYIHIIYICIYIYVCIYIYMYAYIYNCILCVCVWICFFSRTSVILHCQMRSRWGPRAVWRKGAFSSSCCVLLCSYWHAPQDTRSICYMTCIHIYIYIYIYVCILISIYIHLVLPYNVLHIDLRVSKCADIICK